MDKEEYIKQLDRELEVLEAQRKIHKEIDNKRKLRQCYVVYPSNTVSG